ncbi:MAG TPA: histidine kinase [Actinophytocola sp.]|jgi:signal transduction histidine kinase|nr:histidine kinase [Actinophytocola sp.]
MDWRRWRSVVTDRRVVDAVLVLACLLLTPLAVKTPWADLPRPVIAIAGVLGSAAQWPRRRLPLVATVAGAGAYVLSGNPGPLLVGLYSGAAYLPRRLVWAAAVAGWAGFAGRSWLDAGRLGLADAFYSALLAGLVVAVGVYASTYGALVESLRERARHAEAERGLREEQARAAERARIAREMHDVLAHKVSLIALYAGALELHAGGSERLQQGTALIRTTAREALQELRGVLGMLRIEASPPADLASLVATSTQAGQPVELSDEAGTMPAATARVVYRVVQEGLTNAHKHAPGAPTTVSLRRDGNGSVIVRVRNDAGAPAGLPGAGVGLIGLGERVRLVGGSLRSGPAAGSAGGWELQAVVPWVEGEEVR